MVEKLVGGLEKELARLQRAVDRERRARSEAESIAEKTTRELYLSNRELEGRVEARTGELRETNRRLEAEVAERRSAQAGLVRDALERDVLVEIGRIIGSSLDIEEVYEKSAEQLKRVISFDRISIALADGDTGTLTRVYVAGVNVPGWATGDTIALDTVALQDSLGRPALHSVNGQPPQPHASKRSRREPGAQSMALDAGLRSELTVPLISKDEAIGAMNLRSKKPDAYSAKDGELADRVGTLVAEAIASARLYAEVRREARERETLAAIGRIISSSVRIEDVYEPFTEEVRKLVPFERIGIFTVDLEKDELTMAYVGGLDVRTRRRGTVIPLSGTFAEEIVRTRSGLRVQPSDRAELAARFPSLLPLFDAGIRSFLTVPLISRNEVIGVVVLRSTEPDRYSKRDLALADRIGRQIAGVIANAQLYDERVRAEEMARRLANENEALAEIGRIISASVRIEDVYEPFAEEVRKLVPFERIAMFTIDLEKGELTAAYLAGFDVQARRRGTVFPLAGTQTEEIVRTRSGMLVQPRDRAELTACSPLLPLFDAGLRSFLTVPMISRNNVIGTLALRSTEPNRYSERDLALAERIGSQIAGVIANSQLYAERERTAEQLRLQATALASAPNGIVITDSEGAIKWVNPAFTRLTGYTAKEVVGGNPRILKSGKHEPAFYEGLWHTITSGLVWRGEIINRRKDGSLYAEEEAIMPVRDAEGNITNFIAIKQDITERKRAEEALKRTTTELERSNAELEQFAYVASHDLQEPLRMVSSYTQLLAKRYRGRLDSDADDFIAFAVDGAERMQTLIRDLLAYSRVGSRGGTRAPTSLDEVFDAAVANLRVAIEESGAEVTKGPLPTLSVDASQLTQLFQNLVGNALKFRGAVAPRVHVAAEVSEKVATFSVSDNGIGIEPEYLERIFEIFQRLHTRDEYSGTGIGLAICRRIVEQHKGRIWVESEPGVGTTFYFTVPVDGDAENLQRDEAGE